MLISAIWVLPITLIYDIGNQRIIIPILHQVGGSLGLWLGLGVLQILQHVITIAEPKIKRFFFKVFNK